MEVLTLAEKPKSTCFNADRRKRACRECLQQGTMQNKICFQSNPDKATKKDDKQKQLRRYIYDSQTTIGDF